MKSVLVFGGTTEEHALISGLAKLPVEVTLSVASDYGAALAKGGDRLHVRTGRLDLVSMEAFIEEKGFACVIDATHPYATEASGNIAAAADACRVPCLRLLREPSKLEGCAIADSVQEAAEMVAATEGNVLLTTGSKDLDAFAGIEGFERRLYPRVLPIASSIERCVDLGYDRSHIIAMQGPFSLELNVAMIHQFDIKAVVTKDSGSAGGVGEKLEAARECGASVIVIRRPNEPLPGMSAEEVLARVEGLLGEEQA